VTNSGHVYVVAVMGARDPSLCGEIWTILPQRSDGFRVEQGQSLSPRPFVPIVNGE
jgi:hypothetical protein